MPGKADCRTESLKGSSHEAGPGACCRVLSRQLGRGGQRWSRTVYGEQAGRADRKANVQQQKNRSTNFVGDPSYNWQKVPI